mmetsp:Transcript_23085/g.50678  ORF Transcript_23085/g.50678 Transcript_23085/m.50678 type:complete len:104 (-) Transcript_23085:453-764(-)
MVKLHHLHISSSAAELHNTTSGSQGVAIFTKEAAYIQDRRMVDTAISTTMMATLGRRRVAWFTWASCFRERLALLQSAVLQQAPETVSEESPGTEPRVFSPLT